MKFRWSGAVAYDAEAAAERLNAYLGAIGYRAQGALRWARGNRWKAMATLSPRMLPITIEAKLQSWGAQTLVDVTYEFQRSVRALSTQDADLIVAELRGLSEYLQHGEADFERMRQLEQAATRRARAAMFNTLGLVVLLSLPLAWSFQQFAIPPLLASTIGGVMGGLLTSYLFWRMLRR
ncbi:MAG: hypothetical protein KatS3mg019_1838 [Fimbriimonadales bacterium]|nr:MAG: hypothetical protein KatS3mg019_1838 [Fimbriimonadales bacterium]